MNEEKNKKRNHYWCGNCHIPLITNVCQICGEVGKRIPTDLKPVFRKEYQYYKDTFIKPGRSDSTFPKVLYRHRNRLYSEISNGKTHMKIKVLDNISGTSEELPNVGEYEIQLRVPEIFEFKRSRLDFYDFFLDDPDYREKLIKGNIKKLHEIEAEAIKFIKIINQRFKKYYKITSFSGGKDSTVTAFLVQQVLGDIPVVFSDTGIEYPETLNYVRKHGDFFGTLLFLNSEVDFIEICRKLGPPSRTMRWCCFTNKGAPFSKYYANLEHKHVLSFDGIRREESNLRSNYPREMDNTKYEKQHSAYPILNWSSLEVWLYIIWKKLPYNMLYEHGFSRIGCWACPNNTKFDWFLFSKAYPEMVKDWFQLINQYRHQQNRTRLIDDEIAELDDGYDLSWVEDGDWKGRRVKYHNENNLERLVSPCGRHDFDLYLKNPINRRLKEFFKVFGDLSISSLPSNQKLYNSSNNGLNLSYIENQKHIKFYIEDESKVRKYQKLIFRQINKSENCIDCGACVGSCPQGAISINPKFHIDSEKCNNCLICTGTKYLNMSCIALHYKEKRTLIKLKNN